MPLLLSFVSPLSLLSGFFQYFHNPKGFAPCRRPPRPTGKERDSIAFVVVDAAAAVVVVVVVVVVGVVVVVVAVVVAVVAVAVHAAVLVLVLVVVVVVVEYKIIYI